MSATLLSRYNALLADRLHLDIDKLQNVADEFLRSSASTSIPEPAEPKQPSGETETKTSPASGRCSYLLQAGKNKGTPCGAKEAVAGSARCKTHAKKGESSTDAPANTNAASSNPKEFSASKPASETAPKPKPAPKTKKGNEAEKMANAPVIKKIQEQRQDVKIVKNTFGHYVHEGTLLAWEKDTQLVYGRQMPDGSILPLSDNDIQLCLANGWKYKQHLKVNVDPRDLDDSLYASDVSSSEEEED